MSEPLSTCCGAPFNEPGWPDNDICSQCGEHTGVDDAEFGEEEYAFRCDVCNHLFLLDAGEDEVCPKCIEDGESRGCTQISEAITRKNVLKMIDALEEITDAARPSSPFGGSHWAKVAAKALGWKWPQRSGVKW